MKKIFIFFLIITLSIFSCKYLLKQKGYKKAEEAINLMDNFRYKEALEKIKELEKINPNYYDDNNNIPFLLGNCYENLGDLEKATEYYNKALNEYNYSLLKKYIGYSYYERSFARMYIKSYNLKKGIEIIDKLKKIEFTGKDEIDSFLFNVRQNSRVDITIAQIIYDQDLIKKEGKFEDVNYILNILFQQIDVIKNKEEANGQLERTIFDLLNYKMSDDLYYSDIIWDLDITKEYFKKFFQSGILTKATLEKMKKYVPRDELSESFINLF